MKLNYGKTFLLGFGFFGVSVIWSIYNAYVPIFLSNKFMLGAGIIGIFMTLDNIAALFIQPAVGAYSDRLRTPIGRRMPFILFGAPIAALAFAFLAMTNNLSLFFLLASVLLLAMAVWRTPVVALMPDITPSKFRSQANGIINLMGGVGSIIAFLYGAKLYEANPNYPFWLGAVLVVLAAVLVFIFIREPREYEVNQEDKPSLIESLKYVFTSEEKSPLRMLFAILFWFIAYNGIEAFFTLFAVNHLGMAESDGARLLGQMSLLFVIFALPAGYIGAAIGRRVTISIGIILMAVGIAAAYFIPASTLTTVLTTLPVLGKVPVIGLMLMGFGIAWSLININSLPMVVDMTDWAHIGTFTGLYYLFSTTAAIIGPIMYGWIVQLSGNNYSLIMLLSPIFFIFALLSIAGVKRGEAHSN